MNEEQLRSVEPFVMEAWLRQHGWIQLRAIAAQYSDWTPAAQDRFVLRVSRTHLLDDYPVRVGNAVKAIAERYQKAPDEILAVLAQAKMDKLEFRSDEDVDESGSIEVKGGIQFFDGIKQLLVAGAKATKESRPYFGQRNWQHGRAFLESARLGQTELGSYVVTVLSNALTRLDNVGSELRIPDLPHDDRFVVTRLLHSLAATRTMIDLLRAGEPDVEAAVFDGVADGMSSDLCDALLLMSQSESREKLDVTMHWSPLLEPLAATPDKVSFGHADLESLEKARQILRGVESEAIVVFGYVEALARPEGVRGGPGLVTLKVSRGHRARKGTTVKVALGPNDHERAYRAYGLGIELQIRGDVSQVGNRRWIHNGEIVNPSNDLLVGIERTV